jgi:hypothetical protein
VVAIGCAQEFQLVWTARKRATDPGKPPQFSFTGEQRRVSVFYVYIFDEQMGLGLIKICTYFPYPGKVWVNGHEWAKRQAAAAGIGFTDLSNGFASCDDPAALQRICDRFRPGAVQVWFERSPGAPSPTMAGRRPHCGSATFESRPWPVPAPLCCSRPPASPTGACVP